MNGKVSELVSSRIGQTVANVRAYGDAFYNVMAKPYEATGDGVTNDTAIFQRIVNDANAAGRRAVYCPHGTYYVTALTDDDDIVWFGDNASFTGGYTGTINQMGQFGPSEADFDELKADIAKKTTGFANAKEFGATGGGSADDTAALQAAVDSLPDGGSIYIPPGVYMIDALTRLNLLSNQTLILAEGAELKAIPNDQGLYGIIEINGVENVTVMGGKITGDREDHLGVTGEHGMGIRIMSSKNITIRDLHISDCWGDGLYIGASNPATEVNCENIRVINVISDNNRRQGMSITACIGAVIRDSKFTNTNGTAPQSGVDLEANVGFICKDISFFNCEANDNVGPGFKQTTLSSDPCTNTYYFGCKSKRNQYGWRLENSDGTVLDQCEIIDNTSDGLYGNATTINTKISRSKVLGNAGYGLRLASGNADIRFCEIGNNTIMGVYVFENSIVFGCRVYNNSVGVYLYMSNNIAECNLIENNNNIGLTMQGGSSKAYRNTVIGNAKTDGLYNMVMYANTSEAIGNRVQAGINATKPTYGIRIHNSDDSIFTFNTMVNAGTTGDVLIESSVDRLANEYNVLTPP